MQDQLNGSAVDRQRSRHWNPAGAAYDEIATVYDRSYGDPKSRAEDRMVFQRLLEFGAPVMRGRVLDVGCGTGILLDKIPFGVHQYVGIDPSAGMRNVARFKHPAHIFRDGTAEDPNIPVDHRLQFDLIVSLYGSFSYCLDPLTAMNRLDDLLLPNGRLFFMVCSPAHAERKSYVMRKEGVEIERRLYDARHAADLFATRFDNVQVESFGWLVDKLPDVLPSWAFNLTMAAEVELVGRLAPNRCCYHLVTATKRGGV